MNRIIVSGVAAIAIAGCGGGGDSGELDAGETADAAVPVGPDAAAVIDAAPPDAEPIVLIDAAPLPMIDAGPSGGVCNAVTQTGCAPGDKCAFILDDPMTGIGHTGCIADGVSPVGGACTPPTTAGATDDCAAGGHCYQGLCHGVCDVGAAPCASGSCVGFSGLDFDVCLPGCDPLTQNCTGTNQGCYLTSTDAVCAAVVDPDGPASEGHTGNTQGEPCEFLNNCAPYFGCFDDGMGGGRCLRYCGPVDLCFDSEENPTMCACGTSGVGTPGTEAQCGLPELCGRITGEDVIGVCVPAVEFGCDCAATPICPPSE